MLKKLIISKGVKQKWIAEQLGVSEVTVSNWVKGKAVPNDTHIAALSALLGVSVDTINPVYSNMVVICDNNIISADINLIGGIEDLSLVYKLIAGTDDHLEVSRTKKSFERNRYAIEKNILNYRNLDHKLLFESCIVDDGCGIGNYKFIFWQLCLNNMLVDLISNGVFFKYYFNGKVSIESREIEAFLKEELSDSETFNAWSASTKKIIGSKYLSFLKKIGLVDGTIKKVISPIHVNDKELCLFVYLLEVTGMLPNNIINSKLERYCFMSLEVFIERLKKLANQDYLSFEYTGDRLTVKPLHKSTEILDVLCN